MRAAWLILLSLLLGCGSDRAAPEEEPAMAAQEQSDDAARLESARARVRAELGRRWVRPSRPSEKRCGALGPAESEPTLAVVDARVEPRSVLPLAVTRHVVEPDPSWLESVLAGVESEGASGEALAAAARLEQSRTTATLHVVHYVAPKWLVKAGSFKPFWEAGRLDGWLVLHDRQSGEALCQTRVTVAGDRAGASLAARQRSDERDRLTAELGRKTRQAVGAGLTRLGAESR
jgi:hypothetical protein